MEAATYSRRKNIMIVQHNLTAANTNRQLGITTSGLQKSTEKLSSGYKINRAADDAAGLSISEKMRNQIRGLNKASDNAQDGISLVQTAEGALNEVHSMLQRMSELSVQAANGTNATADRESLNAEVKQLKTEIERVGSTTQFNKMDILKGDFSSSANKTLQVGANQAQVITIEISALTAVVQDALGDDLTIGTATAAQSSITKVQSAIQALSKTRSKLGALQNRLEHTVANLDNISENTQSAESRIRDTDMAEEMVQYSKNNILQQAGQSMLAQANQANQGVLSLLQ
jgi:flagellin